MKRIKLTHGSARISDDITDQTKEALNKLTELAYEQGAKQCDIHSVVESKTEKKKVIIIGSGNSGKATALALAHLDAGVTCLTLGEAKERGVTITKDEIEPITMPIKINDCHLSHPPPTRAERRKEARSKKRTKW